MTIIVENWSNGFSCLLDENWFLPHPSLGFRTNPAFSGCRFVKGQEGFRFDCGLDAEGYRLTRPSGQPSGNGLKVWSYGCSYGFGWAVADEHTFPWLLQQSHPDWSVSNFAAGGYGTTQNLLHLMNQVKLEKPDLVIFNYHDDHIWRNVAAPNMLVRYSAMGDGLFEGWTIPRAHFNPNGEVAIKLIPIVDPYLPRVNPELVEYDKFYAFLVTSVLLESACRIAQQCGAKFIFSIMDSSRDEYGKRLGDKIAGLGGKVCDMGVNLVEPEWHNHPYDLGHPNAKANHHYAERLSQAAQEIL
jgi:hypothetical protein